MFRGSVTFTRTLFTTFEKLKMETTEFRVVLEACRRQSVDARLSHAKGRRVIEKIDPATMSRKKFALLKRLALHQATALDELLNQYGALVDAVSVATEDSSAHTTRVVALARDAQAVAGTCLDLLKKQGERV